MTIKKDIEYIKRKKTVNLSEFYSRFAYPSRAKLAIEHLENKDLIWIIDNNISLKNKPVVNLRKFKAIIDFYDSIYISEYFENKDKYIELKTLNIFTMPLEKYNQNILLLFQDFINKIESWSDLKFTVNFSGEYISINSYHSKKIIHFKKSDIENINKKNMDNIRILCECIVIFKNSIDNINNKINEMGK